MPQKELVFDNLGNLEDLIRSFSKKFPKLPLLQSGQVESAENIFGPENLDSKQLQLMRLMGKAFSEKRDDAELKMVAFTQISPEVFEFFGVDPSLRNAVYLSRKVETEEDLLFIEQDERPIYLPESLLINPELAVPDDKDRVICFEGCGSINYGNLWMYVSRPKNITVKAFLYNPDIGADSPIFVTGIKSKDVGGGVIHHEVDHLNGYDATNSPNTDFYDPFTDKSPIWKKYFKDERKKLKYQKGMELLVKRDSKLIIVNHKNEYLGDFQRVGSKVAV